MKVSMSSRVSILSASLRQGFPVAYGVQAELASQKCRQGSDEVSSLLHSWRCAFASCISFRRATLEVPPLLFTPCLRRRSACVYSKRAVITAFRYDVSVKICNISLFFIAHIEETFSSLH